MFSFICVWISDWVNTGEAGDLRRYRIHYDVTVMYWNRFLSVYRNQYWLRDMSSWPMCCNFSEQYVMMEEKQRFHLIVYICVERLWKPQIYFVSPKIDLARKRLKIDKKYGKHISKQQQWFNFQSRYQYKCFIWIHFEYLEQVLLVNGPLTRYVKLRVVHAPGMPGMFTPPPTSKETAS